MRYTRWLGIVASAALACAGVSCDIGSTLKRGVDVAQKAVEVIDRGIVDIQADQGNWQLILQRVASDLPQELQSTIRTEATQLAQRSIAAAGVEFRCNVDHLSRRAIQGLQRLKAMVTNAKATPPSLGPAFCHAIPEVIRLADSPERRATVTLAGYDMDHKDAAGRPCGVVLHTADGRQIPLDENRVGRTTHYQLTLNVAGTDFENLVTAQKAVKLKISWNGKTDGLPEVLLIPKQAESPRTRTERASPGEVHLTPKHVGGDKDFDTDGGKPMTVRVIGETRQDGNRIMARVYMWAREGGGDRTRVEGWSDWKVAYTAPSGWAVKRATPLGRTDHSLPIARHGQVLAPQPAGEVVGRFAIFGDQGGDEAGSYTRVEARFNPVAVDLEQQR